VGTVAMAVSQPPPTIQALGFMISSSDINNESDEDGSSDSQQRRQRPRPSTSGYLPVSPGDTTDDQTTADDHTDITYDVNDRVRVQHPPVQPSGTSFFDSSYSAGKLVAELPTSRHTAEAKAILNDTIDRREREQDMRDNAAAQLEIMQELAKPWLKDFPHHCIPQDNYQMFDLEDQRHMVEHDLNSLTSTVALDDTPHSGP
jgi:hypothetical protein